MHRRPSRPAALVLAGVATLALLTGCSEGEDAFNTNLPDDQAEPAQDQVVQTPGPVASDLPYEEPPLIVPLPGVTGGVPGEVPTTSAESPGADTSAEDQEQQ